MQFSLLFFAFVLIVEISAVPNTCKNEKNQVICPQLSNPRTRHGHPFYYFNAEDCVISPKPHEHCLRDTGCKLCFIPEIADKRGREEEFHVMGFDRCPPCVYRHWKIDKYGNIPSLKDDL